MKIIKTALVLMILLFFYSCATTPGEVSLPLIPEKTHYETYIEDAQRGDAEAMVQVGISFEEGLGVSVSYEKAYEWYKSASAKGNSHSYFRLGRLYEFGYFVEEDWDSAYEWYLSSAATGFLPAIKKMIEYYEFSPEEQLIWLQKGMGLDDPYSNYRYGLTIEREDKDEALKYFKKADKSDLNEVRGLLSILTLSGQYPFYSENQSLEYLENAAESGDPRSQAFLAWLYEFGTLVEKNLEKSFKLYNHAAKSNEVLAIYSLSRFYGEGIFVAKDPHLSNDYFNRIPEEYYSPALEDLLHFCTGKNLAEQEIVLYRFKATTNDLDAFYHLGMLSNDSDAFQWFWMAAEAGHVPSMYELGKLYYKRTLSDFDPVRAAAWIMVYENKSEMPPSGLNSRDITETLSDPEKLEVSRLFTSLYYDNQENDMNSGFLR